jgi:response regulator RpfG family c-di-GMP phosphodiesterase
VGRGNRLATLTARLAERFQIPSELRADLETAARLQQIGRIIGTAHDHPNVPTRPAWHHTVLAASLLGQVDRLKSASELIRWSSENWDGTGMPDHLVAAQIPLRSRLLRAAGDFLDLVEGRHEGNGLTARQAIAELRNRQGTWYDPLALTHLEAEILGK